MIEYDSSSIKNLIQKDSKDLDSADELSGFRSKFVIEDPDLIYLDGNSLGRLPIKTSELVKEIVSEQWGDRLIRSWNERWLEDTTRIGDKIGLVVGAKPGEVVIADSTSVCLYKAAVSALLSDQKRSVILTDDQNFPSDIQVLRAAASAVSKDHEVVLIESDKAEDPVDVLLEAIDETVALVSLSQVSYRSGWCWDLSLISQKAHQVGAKVLWDLSHSVGVVPVDLRRDEIDLAVGCTYKYLNVGPGAPAFMYFSDRFSGILCPKDSFSSDEDWIVEAGWDLFLMVFVPPKIWDTIIFFCRPPKVTGGAGRPRVDLNITKLPYTARSLKKLSKNLKPSQGIQASV